MKVNKSSIRLYASAEAVINRFLSLPGPSRVSNIVKRIERISEEEIQDCLENVMNDFAARHRNIEELFHDNFIKVSNQYSDDLSWFSDSRKRLLGAYFTKEYSIQAAALFNPSIVSHPDQANLGPGEHRFIMSLRATGEGHISSVIFKTGTVDQSGHISIDKGSRYFTRVKKNTETIYTKKFLEDRVSFFSFFKKEMLADFPEFFTARDAIAILENGVGSAESANDSIKILREIFDTNYDLQSSWNIPIAEKVIFPTAQAESMGMEDVRFVLFTDSNGENCYYGTYTAYDGRHIRTQLIETSDFDIFKIRTLYGEAVSDKGMALFPEKIEGKYVMIARQGGEKINIMFSENLYFWNQFEVLMEPEYTWELVQLGNCGSPIKTEKGWILLTHGVGVMRTYVISAIMLDLKDPSKIIGRLNQPIIKADESEREGYVPNVVYTCGLLRFGNILLVPYALSDSATGFVTIDLNDMINNLTNN